MFGDYNLRCIFLLLLRSIASKKEIDSQDKNLITDDMVKGKDDEETVTKRFLEWAGDLPMVAHNAKFDISFIEMAMKKYNLGEFKPEEFVEVHY